MFKRLKDSLSSAVEVPWLPHYQVKRHALAKRVKLRINRNALLITIPKRFSLKYLPSILEQHKEWILAELTRYPIEAEATLPQQLMLRAKESQFNLIFEQCKLPKYMFRIEGSTLTLLGNVNEIAPTLQALKGWVVLQAKAFLAERIAASSFETKLQYTKLSVRDQQTLWGSCTSKGVINLNYKLVFLPPQLAQHIITHELCHTVHHNHSAKFWRLVEKHDPNYKLHRKEIRHGDQFIPAWLNHCG